MKYAVIWPFGRRGSTHETLIDVSLSPFTTGALTPSGTENSVFYAYLYVSSHESEAQLAI